MNTTINNILLRNVKRHKAILASLILVSFLLILCTDLSPDLYFMHFGLVEDVSCHYAVTGDALEPIDWHFEPASNSIFFHETSCRGRLSSRQACSVESAARAHPDWEIYTLFSAPVSKISLEDVSMQLLKTFSNIKFRRVHLVEYAKATPLAALVEGGALNRTRWPVSHTSDVLRFLTLHKWGGVYLDLDIVVAKSLDGLPKNWAVREDYYYVASSAMAFYRDDVGRIMAYAAMSDLAQNFRGDVWGQNGPKAITRVLKEKCSIPDLTSMRAGVCQGFEVYGPELFFPIMWQHAYQYFEPGEISEAPYMYHIWNRVTHHMKVPDNSLYAKLARKFCPSVYDAYREDFGQ